jgi:hypothetical protein
MECRRSLKLIFHHEVGDFGCLEMAPHIFHRIKLGCISGQAFNQNGAAGGMPPKTFSSYFAAFFLVGFVFEGLAFAVFFAALASAISANFFSIRRI